MRVGAGLPRVAAAGKEVRQTPGPACAVKRIGLRLQLGWPGTQHQALASLLKHDPLDCLRPDRRAHHQQGAGQVAFGHDLKAGGLSQQGHRAARPLRPGEP